MPIHTTAIIDSRAEIDDRASIGPYVVVDGPVRVGSEVSIGPYVHLTGWTQIGAGCRIHTGAVIGDMPQDAAYDGSETYCRIGEGTIIREYATIHRATGAGLSTVLGQRCFIMAGAHVGHNCQVGDDVVLANAALLGGHVQIADGAFLGGAAVVHQFVRIGSRTMISGNARLLRDVPPFMMTDEQGHIAGINTVGMRRAQFSVEEREDAKKAYQTLYRTSVGFTKAIERLADIVQTRTGQAILDFIRSATKRGFAQVSHRHRRSGKTCCET